MKENPNPNLTVEESTYLGDDFVKKTGDVQSFRQIESFSNLAKEKESNLIYQGTPSQVELMYKKFQENKQKINVEIKDKINKKYSNESESENVINKDLLISNESYYEYTIDGKEINTRKKLLTKSKYDEDNFFNNHTSVYGSYYDKEKKKWGFICCKQVDSDSLCGN
jgi:pre-mRNA-processing factor SLU7